MESNITVQVYRWRDDGRELLEDVKEITSPCAVDDLVCAVTVNYVLLTGFYEVVSCSDTSESVSRPLCWAAPEGEEEERLCAVVDGAAVDLSEYCRLLFCCARTG